MFEKLLSLLLHAKGGAVATVLVLGASGALVTATVENGLTTVTITQPSTTTTGSQTTTPAGSTTTNTTTTDPVILALFNNTKKEGASEPAAGNGCSDAAHATNEQVKRVNEAYKKDHALVQGLSKTAPKTDAARTLVRTADSKIKGFRQGAVKQIHGLFKSDECKGNDDEDEADDEDEDDAATGTTTGTTNGTTSTTTTTTVAISCTDQKACADAAIAEMDKVVEDLTTALAGLTTAPATTNTTKTDKAKSDNKSTKHDNKGKGHSEGRSHDNEDDD